MSVMEDRQIKAWLNFNCPQSNNWIVLLKFDEMVGHQTNRHLFKVVGESIISVDADPMFELCQADLRHVYLTYMTDQRLITVVETLSKGIFLIDNTVTVTEPEPKMGSTEEPQTLKLDDKALDQYLEKHGEQSQIELIKEPVDLPELNSIESKIYHLENIRQMRRCVSKKDWKLIGLRGEIKLKKEQQTLIDQICFLDMIHQNDPQAYSTVLKAYIEQSKDDLDLHHNYTVTDQLLMQLETNPQVTQLTICQNFQLNDLRWLAKFPNLRLINIYFNHQLEQHHFEQMVNFIPQIRVINIRCCLRVNIRILLPLFKLDYLEKLSIDDDQFWCQKGIHELFISPAEWKDMFCPSLQKLTINSINLTLDVTDYIIHSCPNLQQLTVDDSILNLITKNVESGLDKDSSVIFNSWQNPNKGTQVFRKIYFKGLLKDTYGSQMFSESMLRKIKEIRAKRKDAEQTALP